MPKLSKKCWVDKTGKIKINCFLLGNQFYMHSNFHQIVCCLVSTSKGLWSFCGIICQRLFSHHNIKHIRNLFKKKNRTNQQRMIYKPKKYSLLSRWGKLKGDFTFPNFGLILFRLRNHFYPQKKCVEDQSQTERGWYTTEDL